LGGSGRSFWEAASALGTATNVSHALAVLKPNCVSDALADGCQRCTVGPQLEVPMFHKTRTQIGIVVVLLAAAGITGGFFATRVGAQNQSIEILSERLGYFGVPVKSVVAKSRVPFQIEIILQSSSKSRERTPDDMWYMQLARREALLAYRLDIKIDGYKLTLINSAGETIAQEENYLQSTDPSQVASLPKIPVLDNETTQRLVVDKLDFGEMIPTLVKISSSPKMSNAGQVLEMQLSVSGLQSANNIVPTFLPSVRRVLDEINGKGASVTICWIKIIDKDGAILLNYIWDVETREETSSSVPGLAAWYPQPFMPNAPSPDLPQNLVPGKVKVSRVYFTL
jgi:hypothetical protein